MGETVMVVVDEAEGDARGAEVGCRPTGLRGGMKFAGNSGGHTQLLLTSATDSISRYLR